MYQATSCVFTGNSSPLDGGVILSTGGLANLEFIDCLFEGKESPKPPPLLLVQLSWRSRSYQRGKKISSSSSSSSRLCFMHHCVLQLTQVVRQT